MPYLFIRIQEISSHHQTICGARVFHPVSLLKLMFLYTWDGCLRESLDCCKRCQDTCCIWWEWETAMDSMKGICASSWVDVGYTNQFCVPLYGHPGPCISAKHLFSKQSWNEWLDEQISTCKEKETQISATSTDGPSGMWQSRDSDPVPPPPSTGLIQLLSDLPPTGASQVA